MVLHRFGMVEMFFWLQKKILIAFTIVSRPLTEKILGDWVIIISHSHVIAALLKFSAYN